MASCRCARIDMKKVNVLKNLRSRSHCPQRYLQMLGQALIGLDLSDADHRTADQPRQRLLG
jgi:hypothetical protein